MALVALVAAAGLTWGTWSAETLDRARREDRLLLLAVSGRDRPAILEDEGVTAALSASFVAVSVDRDERPDLDDLARLALTAVSDADPREPAAPLWAAFTPSLHPIAGGDLDAPDAASLARRLLVLASEYRGDRAGVDLRAGVAAARLAASQTPEAPRGPLDRAAVDRAVAAARDGAVPTPGRLRLLLAAASPSAPAALRAPLGRLLTSLAAAPGNGLADEALRLRSLAEGFSLTGDAALREAAAALAARLLETPRRGDGLFLAAPGDPRAFAFQNGLVISALVASSSALGRTDDLSAAARAAAGVAAGLGPWPALARFVGPDGRGGPAFLEDHAFLAEAFLDLHDATGEPRWRDEAQRAVDAAVARFLDSAAAGFFATDVAHAPLPVRLKSGYDGSRPSANGVMASVLARLGRATGERRYTGLARGVLDAFRGDLQAAPRGTETLAAAALPLFGAESATREAPRPARETRGAVVVEAAVRSAGAALEAAVTLTMTPPWTVNGRRPSGRGLVPLTVSVPDERFTVAGVDYPECESCAGSARVVVRLRPGAAADGANGLRLAARFQACRGGTCEAPESVLLEAPLGSGAPAR